MSKPITLQDPLDGLVNYEAAWPSAYSASTFSLTRVRRILHRLGNPHLGLKAVHVAGTKGKGSVSYLVATILAHHGHRVGLYTSPHLFLENERIRFFMKGAETLVDSHTLHRHLRRVLDAARELGSTASVRPTYFEALTIAALSAFSEANMEYVVLETGLGGRLDATNIVDPLVSVITPISRDHMALLGNSLADIAKEKGGIIKAGRPCVVVNREPHVVKALKSLADRRRVMWVDALAGSWFDRVDLTPRTSTFEYSTPHRSYGTITLGLAGEFQLENFAAAVHALEVLEGYGFLLRVDRLKEAVLRARWPGRLQVLQERPWLVIDGAHNEASALALRSALSTLFPYRRLHLIFGAAKDKAIARMGRILAPLASDISVTSFDSPRAASPEAILRAWKPYLNPDRTYRVERVLQALERALRTAGPEDLICVTGSLYVVGEVLRARPKWTKVKS